MRGRSSKRQASDAPQRQPEAERVSLQLIADKLARLTWRRRLWGVDERQVWHVVQRLDEMYRQLYREQEVRYQVLLEQAQSTPSGQGSGSAEARQQQPPSVQATLLQQPQPVRSVYSQQATAPGRHRFRTS